MTQFRGKFGLPLMGAMLLLLAGLAGCGSEPAPVVQPPAPPPAPPPFQPQPVEVKSAGGVTVATLMTAEGGGYTLNGEPFAGGEVENEGRTYTLALEDGNWVATFQPMSVEVMLGGSGDMITLMTTEAGGWTRMGEAFEAGMIEFDGRMYDVHMEDGMWHASYVPRAGTVSIGESGTMIPAEQLENGDWTAVHPLTGETVTLTEGGMVMAGPNTYLLSSDGAGMWMATFQPQPVEVMLGGSGDMVTLMTTEAGGFTLMGEAFEAGQYMFFGRMYTFTMMDGMWTANYDAHIVMAMLGESGTSIELTQAEDGSWWIGTAAIAPGGMYTAANGNEYRMDYMDGAWMGVFVPMRMNIDGTTAVAHSREDMSGYDVEGAAEGYNMLDMDGMGSIMVGRYMYRVMMDDEGMLMGSIYDMAAATAYDYDPALEGDKFGLSEDGMYLMIDHEDDDTRPDIMVALADLIPDGMAEVKGGRIIDEVRDEVAAKLADFKAWVELSNADGATNTYNVNKEQLWNEINGILATRLNIEDTDGGNDILGRLRISSQEAERKEDERDAIDTLEMVVAALSSEAALMAALSDDGIFEDNDAYGAENASAIYNAESNLTQIAYGTHATEDLRFGAWRNRTRKNAHDALGANSRGAYAWSSNMSRTRWIDVPLRGEAHFEGGTTAIDTGNVFVDGTVAMTASFQHGTVETVIMNLIVRSSGDVWHDNDGYVRLIKLPIAVITRDGITNSSPAKFEGMTDTDDGFNTATGGRYRSNYATVEYQALSTPSQITRNSDATREAEITGLFVGTDQVGSLSAGPLAAIGTFNLMPDGPNNTKGLQGGFGVSRVGGLTLPDPGDGKSSAYEVDFGMGNATNDGDTGDEHLKVAWSQGLYAHDSDMNKTLASANTSQYHSVDARDGGELEIFLWEEITEENGTDNDQKSEHALSIDELYSSGSDSIDGTSFVNLTLGDGSDKDTSALRYVVDQLDRILNGLEAGLTIDDAKTLYARASDKLASTMGIGVASGFTAGDAETWAAGAPLPTPLDDTTTTGVDESLTIEQMRDNVQEAIDALASKGLFAQAVADSLAGRMGAPFTMDSVDGDDTASPAIPAYDANMAHPMLKTKVSARYAFTDFTRFGIWKSEDRDNAADAEPSIIASAFAYSSLDTVPWTANDRLPKGGATFEGKTLAIAGTVTTGLLVNYSDPAANIYEGDITLRVDWGVGDNEAMMAVNTTISNLRDSAGRMWDNDPSVTGTGDDAVGNVRLVDQILLRSGAMSVTDGGILAFNDPLEAADIDVDYRASAGTGVSPGDSEGSGGLYTTGRITGTFLGYDDELGPRAVVGNWAIIAGSPGTADTPGTAISIRGVYGADRTVP